VKDHQLDNRMESFFLAETTKYLYLMFDPDNFIHNTGGEGTLITRPEGQCVIDAGTYTRLSFRDLLFYFDFNVFLIILFECKPSCK